MTKSKVKLSQFKPQAANANKHTERGIALLDKSIRQDGWIGAVTVAADGETFDGSARLERVADIMAEQEPIVVETDGTRPIIIKRTDIPDAQDKRAKRLAIAANAIASADWNPDGDLLAALSAEDDYIAQLVKNDDRAAKAMLEAERNAGGGNDAEPQIDRAAELNKVWQVKTGDLWRIGAHRLLCGDSIDSNVVGKLLDEESIDALITDPPYSSGGQFRSDRSNSTSDKYIQSDSARSRIDFSGDNKDQRAFYAWASFWISEAFARSKRGAIAIIFTDWRQLPIMTDAIQAGGWVWKNIVTWWKPGIRMQRGRFSLSAEYAIYASNGVPIEGEESPQNVLQCNPVSENEHTAEKPVELLRTILGVTCNDSIIYDPFAGSGTTLVACENLRRRCRAIEISPAYCAVILQRMADAFPAIEIERIA